jgi:predicted enzyme related to lactoylglutathione lyase
MSKFAYVATLDCNDPEALAPFWAEALHYRANPFHPPYLTLTDPRGKSPELVLQQVPEPKRVKNRMHLDLFVDDMEREAERLQKLGARRLSSEPFTGSTGDRWIVMADPAGNEFCVCYGDLATLEEP